VCAGENRAWQTRPSRHVRLCPGEANEPAAGDVAGSAATALKLLMLSPMIVPRVEPEFGLTAADALLHV
jgi:hypothetical protein